jgi:hypothetical protein
MGEATLCVIRLLQTNVPIASITSLIIAYITRSPTKPPVAPRIILFRYGDADYFVSS